MQKSETTLEVAFHNPGCFALWYCLTLRAGKPLWFAGDLALYCLFNRKCIHMLKIPWPADILNPPNNIGKRVKTFLVGRCYWKSLDMYIQVTLECLLRNDCAIFIFTCVHYIYQLQYMTHVAFRGLGRIANPNLSARSWKCHQAKMYLQLNNYPIVHCKSCLAELC